jgi:hypothetical protein
MSTSSPTPSPIQLPTWLRIALSIIVSAISVLNVTTLHIGGSAASYLSAGLAFALYIGIQPLTGDAFQNLLLQIFPAKVLQQIHGVIGGIVVFVTAVITQSHWSVAVTAIVLGVVNEFIALGFGPAGTAPIITPPTKASLLERILHRR